MRALFLIFPVGPAHTPEDLAMLVEEEQVLFVGDLMFAGRVPFVGDASRNAAADLHLTRDYLVYLRQTMGAAAHDLVDFEEAYAKTDWSRFAYLPCLRGGKPQKRV